jgi:hypothetical protein
MRRIAKGKGWRLGLFGAVLAALASLFLMAGGAAVAAISPPNCTDNALALTISRSPSTVQPGDTIHYTVRVAQPTPPGAACDVTGATVTFTFPSATNGTPTGTTVTLATNASFLANGSGNTTYPVQNFTVPADGSFAAQSATAKAEVTGVLHDAPRDDAVDITKTSTTAVVDAGISISPSKTNPVGLDHVFTIQVHAIPDGVGPAVFNSITPTVSPAPDTTNSSTCGNPTITPATTTTAASLAGDTSITVASAAGMSAGQGITIDTGVNQEIAVIASIVGNTINLADPLANAHAAGAAVVDPLLATCTVTIHNSTAGVFTANASASVTISGVTMARDTDPGTTGIPCGPAGASCAPAVKQYVDAKISISPNGTNAVGATHTFTGHVDVNDGNGGGFVPAPAGTLINFSIAPGGVGTLTPASCTTIGTTGSCSVIDTSSTVGVDHVSASTTLTVHGTYNDVTLTRTTDTTHGSSGPATKQWVDAKISITPNGTNAVGATHIFTGHVDVNPGTGFVNAPAGTVISFSIAAGGVGTLTPASCSTVGTTGSCSVTDTSSTPGVDLVSASTTLTIHGTYNDVTLTRSTDSTHGSSGPATKEWADAKISITPNGTNAVGQTHTFTGHVDVNPGTGFVSAPAGTVINFSIAAGGVGTLTPASCTTVGTTGSCSATDTSTSAGTDVVSASTSVTIHGTFNDVTLSRSTDGTHGSSGPATKQWVDAKISISPNGTNPVGATHTFTAHVDVNPGTGFVPAPAGTLINFSIAAGGVGTLTPTSCTTVGTTGSCSVTDTSSTAGVDHVTASTTLTIVGTYNSVMLTRSTDTTHGSSGPATKEWVDAKISITPNGTNAVGATHTFTAHVDVNPGTGFVSAPAGTLINFSIAAGGVGTLTPTSCTTVGTTGSCSVTDTSSTVGVDVVSASTTVTVKGTFSAVMLTRSTDGTHGSSGPATKEWVDAKISITPNGTNAVGATHTFTGHVDVNPGTGFVSAPAGTVINFSIAAGGVGTLTPASCSTVGTTGSCSVTDTSSTAGVDHVTASTSVTIHGTYNDVTLTRSTDSTHGSSGPATKQWVDAKISITPNGTNPIGATHTFTAHVDVNPGTGFASAPAGTTISFSIAAGGVGTLTPTSCTTVGTTGSCSVTDTSSTAGVDQVSASTTVTVHGTFNDVTLTRSTDSTHGSSGPATKQWADAKISITPAFATNAVGQTHTLTAHVDINPGTGFVNAPAGTLITFSIGAGGVGKLSATSCTTVGTTGSCSVNDTTTGPGIDVITASTTVTIHGTYGDVTLTRSTDTTHGSSGPANKLWIATQVHNSAHQPITTITAPAPVHDNFQAAPGVIGSVTFTLYDTIDCSGTPDAANPPQTVPLNLLSNGVVESTPITLNPSSNQAYSFLAHYTADPSSPYPGKDAACEPFNVTVQAGVCPAPPAVFGLGTAGNYTVLGLSAADLIISEAGTSVKGNVGLGANGVGSLLKATINGKLFLDPTAHPDIHPDLTVSGGIVIKSMAQENTDALAANLALAALAPTQTLGPITNSTTISGGPGTNVIRLNGGVNMVKGTLTISGSPSSIFVINVAGGGFNFSTAQMVLTGGVQPNNIVWNFIGPGADIDIFKTGTQAYGTFLAPYRNLIQDHAILNGRYIGATGGLTLEMHSAATVVCP